MKPKDLLTYAHSFEKHAGFEGVDPADITRVLQRARLIGSSSLVSPLLERASIAPGTQCQLNLEVHPGPVERGAPECKFNATLTPDNPQAASKLAAMMTVRFGKLVSDAILAAKLNIIKPVYVDYLKIKRLGQ